MKKTILALAVTSMFSVSAMATDDNSFNKVRISDVAAEAKANWEVRDINGTKVVFNGDKRVGVATYDDASSTYSIVNRQTTEHFHVNAETGEFSHYENAIDFDGTHGQIIDDVTPNWNPNNNVMDDHFKAIDSIDAAVDKIDSVTGGGQTVMIDGQHVTKEQLIIARDELAQMSDDEKVRAYETIAKMGIKDITVIDDNDSNRNRVMEEHYKAIDSVNNAIDSLDDVSNSGQTVEINGQRLSQQELIDAKNLLANLTDSEKVAAAKELAKINSVTVVDGDTNNGSNKVIDEDTNNSVDIDEASKEVDRRIEAAGASVYKDAAAYAAATETTLQDHGNRITSLESQMKDMGNKMLVLEDRMDGVVASSHAITNARPVLNSAGQFGMGMGVGAAGSKQAIAIGGAYQITDNWSGTMSVNYETKGKVSNHQVSAGVGAQYIF